MTIEEKKVSSFLPLISIKRKRDEGEGRWRIKTIFDEKRIIYFLLKEKCIFLKGMTCVGEDIIDHERRENHNYDSFYN